VNDGKAVGIVYAIERHWWAFHPAIERRSAPRYRDQKTSREHTI
jgi:hypothetical protein